MVDEEKEEKIVSLADARNREKPEEENIQEAPQEPVHCSFCGRPNHMVIKMIKGPGVSICSECVMICMQYFMLEDRVPASEVQKILDTFWRGAKK